MHDPPEINVLVYEEVHMEHLRHREIGKEHAKCNRQKQKRLKAFYNGEVHQNERDCDHHPVLPLHRSKAGTLPQITDRLCKDV